MEIKIFEIIEPFGWNKTKQPSGSTFEKAFETFRGVQTANVFLLMGENPGEIHMTAEFWSEGKNILSGLGFLGRPSKPGLTAWIQELEKGINGSFAVRMI